MLLYNSWHHTILLITPHISLTFSQQDIKHVGVCGSSANFSQKNIPVKITQNKVCTVYAREGSSGISYAYVLAPSDMEASFSHYVPCI